MSTPIVLNKPIVLNNGINTAESFDLKVIIIRAAPEGVMGGFRPICNQTGACKYNKCLI